MLNTTCSFQYSIQFIYSAKMIQNSVQYDMEGGLEPREKPRSFPFFPFPCSFLPLLCWCPVFTTTQIYFMGWISSRALLKGTMILQKNFALMEMWRYFMFKNWSIIFGTNVFFSICDVIKGNESHFEDFQFWDFNTHCLTN